MFCNQDAKGSKWHTKQFSPRGYVDNSYQFIMPSCTTCTHNISHHLAISFANWQSLGQPTGGFQFMASTSSSRLCHTISSIETY